MHRWLWVAFTLSCFLLATLGNTEIPDTPEPEENKVPASPFTEDSVGKDSNFTTLQGITDSDTTNSIAYGYNARKGQYAYVVVILIYYYRYYYRVCGGVIINQHSVLTAAHCLRYHRYYRYYVAVGIVNLRYYGYNPGAQVIKVTSYTIHPQYNPYGAGFPNNLAVLHLDCRIKYSAYVKPAPLATKYDGHFSGYYCRIVGWGRTEWGYPTTLQTAGIYSISNYMCRLFWAVSPRACIMEKHICMYRYPVSSCYGDAGGPLICRGKVVGIMSWGNRACHGCFPGVCSRVSSYIRWIRDAATLS